MRTQHYFYIELAKRVREGNRDEGGVAFEFPIYSIQETLKRPTAALDRNLQYLSLVEILYGYPTDGVVPTAGCDKTTPAQIMAAARSLRPRSRCCAVQKEIVRLRKDQAMRQVTLTLRLRASCDQDEKGGSMDHLPP
jgi:dihydroxyacid dehydratase/phosphogluconate dehydratase